jgi:hypothetical protein
MLRRAQPASINWEDEMKRKAMTWSLGILWGACMLFVGLTNMRTASYGSEFLRMMSSVYPGFHDSRTLGDVIVGTIYGFVDGAILGFVLSSLYRWIGGPGIPEHYRVPQGLAADPAKLRQAS